MTALFSTLAAIVFGSYLTFVNFLADGIAFLFETPNTDLTEQTDQTNETAQSFDELPSEYEYGGQLPDILIKNAAYQKASVIESTDNSAIYDSSKYGEAVVNIYCQYRTDEYLRTTTGTGFFINRSGVILTNAHVAQYLLLNELSDKGSANCIVRTGETASSSYMVDLLYISPAWIQKNAALIRQAKPKGTGERDYALLYVTDGLNKKPVPADLPHLSLNTEFLPITIKEEEVSIAGYPAEILFTEGFDTPLTRKVGTTSVAEIFTFGSNYADLFYMNGSPIGESGVSGGPVIDGASQVIGLISTKNDETLLGKGSLNAITISYIDRTMREETGFGIKESITGNLAYRAKVFKATVVPFLTKILEEEL